MKSKSDKFLEERYAEPPQVSALMASSVSNYRKDKLEQETNEGYFKHGSSKPNEDEQLTKNSFVTASYSFKKSGQVASNNNYRGAGDTAIQIPEIYSPLWLTSNLSLPRDRATINAWLRSFFTINPFVQNAISLHSTYPISKLNIKCKNKKIEKFFNDMIEEMDLMNICVQIAQEYWLLGEAFVFAELNQSKGTWERLVIQNPDHMVVQRTVVDSEPMIMLKPDENLKRIVTSNKPSDLEQRKKLNQYIIDSVKKGNNIPLPNFNISHLARRISPYEIRGTGLPVAVFKQLMLFDKLRECHDDQTEVLTDKGFLKIKDITTLSTNVNIKPEGINGAYIKDGNVEGIFTLKDDFKVACYNPISDSIEYHKPEDASISYYEGEMHHYVGSKVDLMVTPNHKLYVKEKYQNGYTDFELKTSKYVSSKRKWFKFKSKAKWNGKDLKEVEVCNSLIPINDYLKFLGYVVSEACVYQNYENGRYDNKVVISQATDSDCYEDMKDNFNNVARILNKNVSTTVFEKTESSKEKWQATIYGKDIVNYLKSEIGTNNKCNSYNKKLPRWVLELKTDNLKVLLNALVKGDGTERFGKNSSTKGYTYTTVSKQLADDVYELAFKCGFVPNITEHFRNDRNEYYVTWSNTNYGTEPNVLVGKNYKGGGATCVKEEYKGVVWCLQTPTGIFITRRNGKISIQGNSKFAQSEDMINPWTLVKVGSEGNDGQHPTHADLGYWRDLFESAAANKNFKIFTHPGVSIERVGAGGGIVSIGEDITQLIKEIYIGLQVPSALMDGGSDTTYANAGVGLDVLKQRYMQFRNMLGHWLKKKIFAPISEIQEFYDYVDGKKELIIPDVDWNYMSLFDAGDYTNVLIQLAQPAGDNAPPKVSLSTVYRSLGLEMEDEVRKIKKESIQSVIFLKEKEALMAMDLNSLRTLGDDDEIKEPVNKQNQIVPGEMGQGGAGMDMGGMGGMGMPGVGGGLDMGGISPPPPSSPPAAPPPSGGAAPPAPPATP